MVVVEREIGRVGKRGILLRRRLWVSEAFACIEVGNRSLVVGRALSCTRIRSLESPDPAQHVHKV